jgi:GABA permease
LAGFAGCLVNYVFPGKVFGFLLSTTGAIALLVYLVIAVSQLRMRARADRDGTELALKMWLFPWLTWLVIGTIVMVLGYMLFSDAYRYETLMTAGVTLFILLISLTRRRHTAPSSQAELASSEGA